MAFVRSLEVFAAAFTLAMIIPSLIVLTRIRREDEKLIRRRREDENACRVYIDQVSDSSEESTLLQQDVTNLRHHPAPSDSIGISPTFARRTQSERKYYLNSQQFLSRIGLRESSIPQHHRRLR